MSCAEISLHLTWKTCLKLGSVLETPSFLEKTLLKQRKDHHILLMKDAGLDFNSNKLGRMPNGVDSI